MYYFGDINFYVSINSEWTMCYLVLPWSWLFWSLIYQFLRGASSIVKYKNWDLLLRLLIGLLYFVDILLGWHMFMVIISFWSIFSQQCFTLCLLCYQTHFIWVVIFYISSVSRWFFYLSCFNFWFAISFLILLTLLNEVI